MSTMIHSMAREVERRNRFDVEKSGRNLLMDETKAARNRASSSLLAGIRRSSGNALIRIGSHLSGAPRPEPSVTTRPAW